MTSPRSTQLFHSEFLISRIQQKRIDMRGIFTASAIGLATDVNDLNELDARKGHAIVVRSVKQLIDDLNRVRPAATLLR